MIVIVFLAALLLLYTLWVFTVKRGLKNLSCTRAFSRLAVFAGEEAELVEVVRNDRAFVIPWLLVESRISPYLRLGKQDNLFVSGEMHYCSQFTLLPYQQIRRRHRVRFLHRGAYNLGNASLTAGDILGFFQFQRTQELDVPVLVYPRLLELEELPIPMSRMLGELTRRIKAEAQGIEAFAQGAHMGRRAGEAMQEQHAMASAGQQEGLAGSVGKVPFGTGFHDLHLLSDGRCGATPLPSLYTRSGRVYSLHAQEHDGLIVAAHAARSLPGILHEELGSLMHVRMAQGVIDRLPERTGLGEGLLHPVCHQQQRIAGLQAQHALAGLHALKNAHGQRITGDLCEGVLMHQEAGGSSQLLQGRFAAPQVDDQQVDGDEALAGRTQEHHAVDGGEGLRQGIARVQAEAHQAC